MVESDNPGRRRRRTGLGPVRVSVALALAVAALSGGGCGLVPRGKMEQCRRLTQTLRAENDRLKDVALDLRAQNQDLTQRAVDDANRLAAQDEAVERLEKSVQAYQAEREQMASALESVKRQMRVALSPHAAAVPPRLKSFAEAHPGWSFDPATLTLSAPPDRLFSPGTDRLRPEAEGALSALASALTGPGAAGLSLEVSGPPDDPGVTRAGYDADADAGPGDTPAAPSRFLASARAARVRDLLVRGAGLDPTHARVAPPAARPGSPAPAVLIRLDLEGADPTPNPDPDPDPGRGPAPGASP